MQDKTKAILFMLAGSFSFAAMSAMIKLAGDLPAYEKVFFRGFISAVFVFFVIRHNKVPLLGKRKNQPYLILRALLGTTAMSLYFYGVTHMYLADASMLSRLNPFFVTLFAALFLKEKLSKAQIPALIIAFGAAMLIIKPEFSLKMIPSLAIVGAAMFSGGSHTTLRALRGKEAPSTIIFYFAVASTLFVLPLVIMHFQMPQGWQWVYLLSIGFFAITGQFSLTNAFRLAPASEITIYNYVNIVFAAILGYFIWGEVSDIWSITGGVVIVGVSMFSFLYNRRRDKMAAARKKEEEELKLKESARHPGAG